ncbi:MAG: hypothetical protein H6510_12900 [Acidobacteria bacterium]|nr:hypothetical protein [Acidobacteriota bacterium]MCB9398704.1 hypothetical protein [Acidobacteriota bacterium]
MTRKVALSAVLICLFVVCWIWFHAGTDPETPDQKATAQTVANPDQRNPPGDRIETQKSEPALKAAETPASEASAQFLLKCQAIWAESGDPVDQVQFHIANGEGLSTSFLGDYRGEGQVSLEWPDQEVWLWAEKDGFCSAVWVNWLGKLSDPCVLALKKGEWVSLEVRAKETQKPIAGARFGPNVPPTCQTDRQGRWQGYLWPGSVTIQVQADGFQTLKTRISVQANAHYVLEMQRGGSIAGTITDAQGAALADVSVSAGLVHEPVQSDAKGHYHLSGLPLSGSLQIRAWHPRFRVFLRDLPETPERQDPLLLDIVLEPIQDPTLPLVFQGSVMNPQGSPLENVIVSLENAQTQTTVDGFFSLTNNKEGMAASFNLDGYLPLQRRLLAGTHNEVLLFPGTWIEGHVLQPNGLPARATLHAYLQQIFRNQELGRTDEQGYFGCMIPNQANLIGAFAPGYYPSRIETPAPKFVTLFLEERVIPIEVIDAQGKPVQAFTVYWNHDQPQKPEPVQVQSRQGIFYWRPESFYEGWKLCATSGTDVTQEIELHGDELGPIQLQLESKKRGIRAQVLDAQGAPVVQFPVRITAFAHGFGPGGSVSILHSELHSFMVPTDAQGQIWVTDLEPQLFFQLTSGDPRYSAGPLIIGKPSPDPPVRELRLSPAAQLEVQIDLPDIPANGVRVRVTQRNTHLASFQFRPGDPVLRLENLPALETWVALDHPQYGVIRDSIMLEPGPINHLTLRLRGVTLYGQVWVGDRIIEYKNLALLDQAGQTIATETPFGGGYQFVDVKPGNYSIQLDPEFPIPQRRQAIVVEKTRKLDLHFEPFGPLTGTLEPPLAVNLFRLGQRRTEAGHIQPNASGAFSVFDLAPGRYEIAFDQTVLIQFEKGEGPLDIGKLEPPQTGQLQIYESGPKPMFAQLLRDGEPLGQIPRDGLLHDLATGPCQISFQGTGHKAVPANVGVNILAGETAVVHIEWVAITEAYFNAQKMILRATATHQSGVIKTFSPSALDPNQPKSCVFDKSLYLHDELEGQWFFELELEGGERVEFERILSPGIMVFSKVP